LVLAGVCVLLVGLNLRPAITAVALVLSEIRASYGLDPALAGLLTTVPLLMLVALSAFMPVLGRRFGMARVILASLIVLGAGFGLRLIPGVWWMFVGMAVIGAAIAAGNVLLPAFIKGVYPGFAGPLTGLYTVSLYAGPALAAAATVPLARATGSWQFAITAWVGLVALAVPVWLTQIRRVARSPGRGRPEAGATGSSREPSGVGATTTPRVWSSPTAWAVTGFFAVLSALFYTISAWLPTIMTDRGLDQAHAGLILTWVNLAAIPCALIVSIAVHRTRRQVWATTSGACLLGVGLTGLVIGPIGTTGLWAVVFGLGHGVATGVAYSLPLLRSTSAAQTASLGGMSQTAGYALSAAGPAGIGAVYQGTGSWTPVLAILLVAIAFQGVVGLKAARPAHS
jgi:CP family cyanate transporter-like MFS transporter